MKSGRSRRHELDLLPEIADKVEAEFLVGSGRWNALDAKTGGEACACEGQQRIAGVDFVAVEALSHRSAGDRADDDGEEGAELDDAVAPGQALGGKKFRQQSVFRRRPKSAAWVATRPSATSVSVVACMARPRVAIVLGADLHRLRPDGDLALAEAVGKPAAGHAEEHEGY